MNPEQLQALAAFLRSFHTADGFSAVLREAEALARRQGLPLAPVWREIEAEIVRLAQSAA